MFARMCRFQSKHERIQQLGEKAEKMEVHIIYYMFSRLVLKQIVGFISVNTIP